MTTLSIPNVGHSVPDGHTSDTVVSTPTISKRGRGRPRKSHQTARAMLQSEDVIDLSQPSPASLENPLSRPTRGRPRGSKNRATLAKERRQTLEAATITSASKIEAASPTTSPNAARSNAITALLHRLNIERTLRQRQALDQELIRIDETLASLRRRALVRFAPGMLRIPDVNTAMRPLVDQIASLEARRTVLLREVVKAAERLGVLGRKGNAALVRL